jgi:hypothetical protein
MKNMTGDTKSSFDFLVISSLRAILDSYYCEFMYNGQDILNTPTFSEYVYYWLGKYKIDEVSRKIKTYQVHNDEDNNRLW